MSKDATKHRGGRERLTLPGTLHGLLRRGSPVVPAGRGWHQSNGSGPCSEKAKALVRKGPWLDETVALRDLCLALAGAEAPEDPLSKQEEE